MGHAWLSLLTVVINKVARNGISALWKAKRAQRGREEEGVRGEEEVVDVLLISRMESEFILEGIVLKVVEGPHGMTDSWDRGITPHQGMIY